MGDSPPFFEPSFFISDARVQATTTALQAARKRNPSRPTDPCEKSFTAADQNRNLLSADHYDDNGLMAMVCRHGRPLFLANITTPGEQQEYALALIEALFECLPDTATVLVLYDIGCVLECSIHKVLWLFLCHVVVSNMLFIVWSAH